MAGGGMETELIAVTPDEAKLLADFRKLKVHFAGGRVVLDVRNGRCESYELTIRQTRLMQSLLDGDATEQRRLREQGEG